MARLTSAGVRFATSPAIDELNSRRGIFPTSTAWVFYQANAPTGWTKVTTHNNKALRVVNGNGGGFAGTNDFTTTMSSFNIGGTLSSSDPTDAHMLLTSEIASHSHASNGVQLTAVPALFNPDNAFIGWNGGDVSRSPGGFFPINTSTGTNAGNVGHSHPVSASGTVPNQPLSIAVQYIDVIVCTFNG
jgi:hypothetical protein